MQADSGVVVEKVPEGIVQIRLNRPDRLNALGVDMVDALLAAITDAVAGHARVILMRWARPPCQPSAPSMDWRSVAVAKLRWPAI